MSAVKTALAVVAARKNLSRLLAAADRDCLLRSVHVGARSPWYMAAIGEAERVLALAQAEHEVEKCRVLDAPGGKK